MIYLDDLLQATGATPHGQVRAVEFSDFAFDSRRLAAGQLFLAVKTATGDGHDFIGEAIAKGAAGVLCQRPPNRSLDAGAIGPQVTTLIVPDTQQALTDYAGYMLRKYRPQVVGVTGSSGKTTAKDAIALVLGAKLRVFKNFGSYNGRYGLPIALGQLRPEHQVAVLEMACDSFNEIGDLARLTRPAVGVVTTVNHTHLARLGTLDNVAAEKGRLIEALSFDGAAVLNADDPRVAGMVPRTQARIITYGLKSGADVRATDLKLDRAGAAFTLRYEGRSYPGRTPLLGRHQLYPILAAVATGIVFEIPVEVALSRLARLSRLPGRLNPLPGLNGALIIDDTFNASPDAALAALETLEELPGAIKIAILGDMPDLGDYENKAHWKVGEAAAKRVHYLVTKGEKAQLIARAALHSDLGQHAVTVTFTSDDAAQAALPHLSADTTVLVKGGAAVRMERVVRKLLADPERDAASLVRQDPGWERIHIGRPDRPTWIEIDLIALARNVRCLVELAAPARLMAVLKADAYGHGAVKVARTALNNGASWVGVATFGEAVALRQAGIDAPILVLGYMPAWQARDAIHFNISATIFTPDLARAFSQAAADLNQRAYVHVKVDTGMGRLGLQPDEVVPFLQAMAGYPGLVVEGLFTHFATADEADLALAREQLARFQTLLDELTRLGLRPPLVHAANTGGLLNLPQARFDMIRPGIALYGLDPSAETPLPEGFQPVLSFKTTVAQVKQLKPGSPVGYGATYRTQGEETIAIIPVGYADGFRRAPSRWQEVLVKGKRAPLVGRVSMDQSAINVTHIPNVRQGDEVVLIGRQGQEVLSADEVAQNLGTINYEVVSQILARVPRVT
ncbi:MAG: alanine racemase [Anaerolineae bacterium]